MLPFQLLPYLASVAIVALCVVFGALVVDQVLNVLDVDHTAIRVVGISLGAVGGFVLGDVLTVLSTVLAGALA